MTNISPARFFKEAHRRQLFKITGLYIFGAFVVLQVADLAFPGLGIPESAIRYVWIATILGFPVALAFGWRFDVVAGRVLHTADTDGGGDRSLNRADFLILGIYSLAAIAIVAGLGIKIMDSPQPDSEVVSPKEFDATSIAVLAFENLSPDPDNAYFAEGISEEILNVLAKIDGLKVISRTSAFSFRGSKTPIPEIARLLGVANVLEGSVRKQGSRVRITAQLIDTRTDTHLWSESYDRELSDIFAVQEELAQSVAVALQDVLGVRTVKVDMPTTDLEAYQLFLQGREMFYQRGEALIGAIEALQAAVERDPDFTLAWAYLAAAAEVAPGHTEAIKPEDANVLADEASQKALELDPNLGFALAVRGRLQQGRGELIEALDLYQRAIIANPEESTSHLWLGLFNFSYGYLSQALLHLERAYELDPLVRNHNNHLCTAYLASGQMALSEPLCAKAQELGAGFSDSLLSHLVLSGDVDAAVANYDKLSASSVPHIQRLGRLYVEALRNRDIASVDALVAEENAVHGPGHEIIPKNYLWFNFRDQFFDHYSPLATTTPLYDIQPVWLPGNRAYIEDPRFFKIMSGFGAEALWEQHGYPDGCIRVNDPAGDFLNCAERYR
jgi:TolB-like protein